MDLAHNFFRVITRLKKLHKRKCQNQGRGKPHNGNGKKDNSLKILIITGPSGRKIIQKYTVQFRCIKREEYGKQQSSNKSSGYTCCKSFAVTKAFSLFNLGILDGLIDAKSGNYPIKKTIEHIGMFTH